MREHLISTRVVQRQCPRCGTELLVAIDEGIPAHVDAAPIDPADEIAALLTGRWTYALRRGELVHRDEYRIRGGYAGEAIHAQHRCQIFTQPTLIGVIR